jgi:hypothetical protein
MEEEKSFRMRNLNGVVLAFCGLLCFLIANACATVSGVSDTTKQELLSKGIPIAILSVKSGSPNSAGGVNAYVYWQNISDKEIKYVVFTVTPYNRVNDVAPSEIGNTARTTLRDTGPFKPNSVQSGGFYENVWYNHTITHLTLDGIIVTFMDGTEFVFDSMQINQAYPKQSTQKSGGVSSGLSGDPTGRIIGTWKSTVRYIKFDGNKFLIFSTYSGGVVDNAYTGTFSLEDNKLTLDVTDGSMASSIKGEHTGSVSVTGDAAGYF